MKPGLVLMITMICLTGALFGQDTTAVFTPTPTPKRSWFSRVMHPSPKLPQYKDPKLRGLDLQIALSTQPLKLSETRQMEVKVVLTNRSKHAIELNFPTD